MPIDMTKVPTSTTPEQNRSVGRFGEPTTVDTNTFEIVGTQTGTVFGSGSSLSEALALQTQFASGGTPTVAGRPDLFAVEPTAAEQTAGIRDVNIADAPQPTQMVTPRTATPEELAQRAAGTLPTAQAERALPGAEIQGGVQATLINPQTGEQRVVTSGSAEAQQLFGQGFVLQTAANAPTGDRALPGVQAPGVQQQPPNGVDALSGAVSNIIQTGSAAGTPTDGAPGGDLQAAGQQQPGGIAGLRQQAANLRGEQFQRATEFTEEELRKLSPAQQAALRRQRVTALSGQLGNVQSAIQTLQAEEEARKSEIEKQQNNALNQLNLAMEFGALGLMSDEERNSLALAAGIDPSVLNAVMTASENQPGELPELRSVKGVGIVQLKFNPETGEFESTVVQREGGSGLGTAGSTSTPSGDFSASITGEDFNDWASGVGNGTITQDFDTHVGYISGRTTHSGYDIGGAGHEGEPVTSPISGKVVESKDGGGWGQTVVIEDNDGNRWRFAHFADRNVQEGEVINAGTSLGTIGSTGKSTGPHVHVEVKDSKGRLFDPATLVAGSASPLPDSELGSFRKVISRHTGEDGFVDTDVYKSLAKKALDLGGKEAVEIFNEMFPAELYLNPNDLTAQVFFKRKPTTSSTSSSGAGGIPSGGDLFTL